MPNRKLTINAERHSTALGYVNLALPLLATTFFFFFSISRNISRAFLSFLLSALLISNLISSAVIRWLNLSIRRIAYRVHHRTTICRGLGNWLLYNRKLPEVATKPYQTEAEHILLHLAHRHRLLHPI